MNGKKKTGPPLSSHKTKGSVGIDERRSFLRGSAYLIACFGCFLLGFRISWEGKAAFFNSYRPAGRAVRIRDPLIDSLGGFARHSGLDLSPGAWESGQGDKYGAGVADGEWERIEERILASANESVTRRGKALLRRPPADHPWVGRHNISIRPWPHPDAGETLLAHALIAAVQREQQRQFGVPLDRRKRVIVVTPTYKRSFQRMHLGHLTDTLRLAPEPLSWVVVEAGGPTEETQTILSKTGLSDIHLLPAPGVVMPDVRAQERGLVEDRLRDIALSYIQETALDGIVVFADDSSTLRLALFQELQKVQWFAAFSVGMLVQNGGSEVDLPVQGPMCDAEGEVIGWHAADHELLKLKKSAGGQRRVLLSDAPGQVLALEDQAVESMLGGEKLDPHLGGARGLQQSWEPEVFIPKLEWVSFAFNARLLWDPEGRPHWLKEWKPWGKVGELLLDLEDDADPGDLLARMVEDERQVETLGRCGKDMLAWWLRVEAADGGQYPADWWLSEGLPVVAEPKVWDEQEWQKYEAQLVEEKKKKKKKGKKKKKKAPEETKPEEDAEARQAAEQAAADEARRLEEEKQRAAEQEAARQAEEAAKRAQEEATRRAEEERKLKAEENKRHNAEEEKQRKELEGKKGKSTDLSTPSLVDQVRVALQSSTPSLVDQVRVALEKTAADPKDVSGKTAEQISAVTRRRGLKDEGALGEEEARGESSLLQGNTKLGPRTQNNV